MAVLVSQDWQPPKDHTMDALPSQSSAINPAVPRQRSSPANDQAVSPTMSNQQQPYPYPVQQQQQQQQAGWSPAHSPQQYYPAFYQNQPSYPVHGHPPQQQMHAPYYDPANNQYAQWAYQQMMFTAQQQAHQMSHVPQHIGSQRGRSAPPSGDYFAINQLPGFNPFPSGTPPPHPSQLPNGGYPPSDQQPPQYQGFHPYRRPPRQASASSQDPAPNGEWRPPPQTGPFQAPYVRADAAGSSTSINSSSSSQRQRTNSNQGPPASPPSSLHVKPSSHPRGGSAVSSPPPSTSSQRTHGRTSSTSSASSTTRAPSTTTASTSVPAAGGATQRKPSPLSQGNFTAAEKRMSRDDSDLAAMLEPNPNAPGVRSGGLKGRLRRALSLGANNTLLEEDEGGEEDTAKGARPAPTGSGSSQATITGDDESTATVQKKKSRSLFNSRLNRSTDNISLSSTMSSASMVIRKLGSIGKLTRRNSLAGITSLFKDKKEKEDEEAAVAAGKKTKKKKGEKGAPAEASVSMATAELDRTEYGGPELAGLSPAARLARQHTLKSNAEAAAKAKAEAEARAAAAAAAAAQNGEQVDVPTTWEKNTTNRQGDPAGGRRVNEEGMGIVDDNSDSGSDEGPQDRHPQNYSMDGWDDDEDWNEAQEEEDVTIRAEFEHATLEDQEEMEPWAVNVRRSVEKARKPAKGILKTQGYEQDAYLHPEPPFARMRSNSYDSAPSRSGELGPLARIPSPDPDHIDGLHKHNSHSPPNGQGASNNGVFIPPLAFESNGLSLDSPKDVTDTSSVNSGATEKRSATAPAKRLAFASNLSVYDTFPAAVYDRRSEPATWSRLTPALAQRIKEELNSYKMEEMEVHASSRVHTQFFV
ncbi:uncharacterized protein B0H18DRAFT_1212270 [Fomitopsis serialis]|uniref:uncharacterized protein n=1 Tax=Fomitopsis serialis TaxID=139415 RepID=UPI0020071E01|nr:uncharacterized protein B0H18DRAFT_1212270 [Neoantrodia serialis]KAH9923355.1 hypothetical protein B0H18DRAFT_1212270 [Neoantrodia serialis]